MLHLTVTRIRASSDPLTCPWTTAALDRYDILLAGLLLDWQLPFFSLASLRAHLKCHLIWGVLPDPQAQGVAFSSEL